MTTITTPPSRAAVRDLLQAENDQLIEILGTLTPAEWQTKSLCAGWTVRDVTCHLVAQHLTGQLRFLGRLIRAKGDVGLLNAIGIEALREAGTPELLQGLAHGYRLPFFRLKPEMALYETMVHQQDIRRPLGALREIPADALRVVLDVAVRENAPRADGLRLQAASVRWSRGGDGPAVSGPGEALLMALCGRPAAQADLTGAGLGILTSRT
jgi:uncharacterized protein (TIGR03083 family)